MHAALSGYRIMWMLVMFDLPVGSQAEKRAATLFRKHLLDMGFDKAQFSVYYRVMGSKEISERYMRKIEAKVPDCGNVNILTVTDKQYENMVCFLGKKKTIPSAAEQLTLF